MNARGVAVGALVKQEQSGYSNLVLDAVLKKEPLPPRERAFASAVFYGVVERQLTLDHCLTQCMNKPLRKLDAPVRAILRSGLYQAKYLQTPVPAAVNESVKLTRAFGKASASGFVNAVLRRAIAVDPAAGLFQNETQRLSVLYSVSEPVARFFQSAWPQDAEALLAASFQRPATTVRVNPLRTTPQELTALLEREGCSVRLGWVQGSLMVEFKGSPAETDAFQKGLFHVQGQASQLAALCLDAQPGHKVADLCAAPGGKTLTIAQQMGGQGQLYSRDAAPNRVPLIEQAVERCGLTNVQTACHDAAEYDPMLENCDRVLCDVPCTGLGTLAKKPDIRYKTLEDLDTLHTIQAQILHTASRYVKPGGRLVYSTCTLAPEENGCIVQEFLAENPNFRLREPALVPPGAVLEQGMMTLLPNKTADFDGFFIATLERL